MCLVQSILGPIPPLPHPPILCGFPQLVKFTKSIEDPDLIPSLATAPAGPGGGGSGKGFFFEVGGEGLGRRMLLAGAVVVVVTPKILRGSRTEDWLGEGFSYPSPHGTSALEGIWTPTNAPFDGLGIHKGF